MIVPIVANDLKQVQAARVRQGFGESDVPRGSQGMRKVLEHPGLDPGSPDFDDDLRAVKVSVPSWT